MDQIEAPWEYIEKLEKRINALDQKLYEVQRDLEYRIDDTERKLRDVIEDAQRRRY